MRNPVVYLGRSGILFLARVRGSVCDAQGSDDKQTVSAKAGNALFPPSFGCGPGLPCDSCRDARPAAIEVDHPMGQDHSGLKVNAYAAGGGKPALAAWRAAERRILPGGEGVGGRLRALRAVASLSSPGRCRTGAADA